MLVLEPTNPHDRDSVHLDIVGMAVGYLAREGAVDYRPPLRDLQNNGALGWCPAYVMGGGDRFYGVIVRLRSGHPINLCQ